MAAPTVVAMRGHLHELADQLDAYLDEGWEGAPSLGGPGWATGRCEVTWRPDGTIHEAVVRCPTVRDRRAYFTALHEFGHLHALRSGERWANPYQQDARVLLDEAQAWAWAFENALFPPTSRVVYSAQGALLGYVIDLGFADDPHWGADATGHPEQYRHCLAVMRAEREEVK
jgi:hypothetical protein